MTSAALSCGSWLTALISVRASRATTFSWASGVVGVVQVVAEALKLLVDDAELPGGGVCWSGGIPRGFRWGGGRNGRDGYLPARGGCVWVVVDNLQRQQSPCSCGMLVGMFSWGPVAAASEVSCGGSGTELLTPVLPPMWAPTVRGVALRFSTTLTGR